MTAILPPSGGNPIAKPPLTWHQMLVSAFVVGMTIWIVEQRVSGGYAFVLALIILLGVAFAYSGFASELQSIVKGNA